MEQSQARDCSGDQAAADVTLRRQARGDRIDAIEVSNWREPGLAEHEDSIDL
jgi:hypothetical protein